MNYYYQVVLIAEDGEYILSDWQTKDSAEYEANRISPQYGEGQRVIVRKQIGFWDAVL